MKDKKRNKIAKLLEDLGARINFSVFECMITQSQLNRLQKDIEKYVDKNTDTVVYYTLCVDCFTKIVVQPDFKKSVYDLTQIV